MKLFFVVTGNKEELEVIRELKPENILVSYWYFKNKSIKDFCKSIGYKPSILLDSGAYTAFTKGKNVNVIDYMAYIDANKRYLSGYMALDVIGNTDLSVALYDFMRSLGYDPIPVYHYGEECWVLYYYEQKSKRIALGGTVPVRNKQLVSDWCDMIYDKCPNAEYHLLGSSSEVIRRNEHLASCDSTSWYMMAVNGFPKHIVGKTRESKIARAKYQMRQLMKEVS